MKPYQSSGRTATKYITDRNLYGTEEPFVLLVPAEWFLLNALHTSRADGNDYIFLYSVTIDG